MNSEDLARGPMKLKIRAGRATVLAEFTDWNDYNTKLAKLMKKLKKDAGAATIRQNYKGTGSQKARRQLWIRFKSEAVIDVWLDMGYVTFGGVVTNRPPGSDVTLTTKKLPYKDTPEQTYKEIVKILKPWANPDIKVKALTKKDIKKGVKVIQKDHPEYGTWTVKGPAKGTFGTWEVAKDNGRGEIAVDEAELLKFWKKAA
jgi:hypothetical protein